MIKRISLFAVLAALLLCAQGGVAAQTTQSPLCFTAKGGSVEVKFDIKNASHTIQYSTDGNTWTNYTSDTPILLATNGDKVYFRAATDQTAATATAFGNTNLNTSSQFTFTSSDGGTVEASGNIMSLYGPSCPDLQLPMYAFAHIFNGCSLMTTAPELPATTLNVGCYQSMFANCSSLITAPALLATVMSINCYYNMFYGCTSLAMPPALPATSLANNCYCQMFNGCTSLITAPALPADTLSNSCYRNMFNGCTSLQVNTSAPGREWKIPATTTASDALTDMFSGTIGTMNNTPTENTTYYIASDKPYNLTVSDIQTTEATLTWEAVNAIGCSYELYVTDNRITDFSDIDTTMTVTAKTATVTGLTKNTHYYVYIRTASPNWTSGWTETEFTTKETHPLCFTAKGGSVEVRFDIKNVTHTIQYSTDGNTWTNYTSNTTIQLANDGDKVYFSAADDQTIAMAFGASTSTNSSRVTFTSSDGGKVEASGNIMSLYGPNCPNLQLQQDAFIYMFEACSLLTKAPELPATTLADRCYKYMFQGCTSLTTAPELPATTLANSCYSSMFSGCTSLTMAPALPATTLANSCYDEMFNCCTSLTAAPTLTATTLADACYSRMFSGCTSLTTAPELPATTLANTCYSRMFSGCTSLTEAPELPATTLAPYCYSEMFSGCTSLVINTTAPGKEWKIPATTTAVYALDGMFNETGGTMNGTPSVNTTYYIKSDPRPYNITVSDIQTTRATLTWEAVNTNGYTYDLYITENRVTDFSKIVPTQTGITQKTATVTGLTKETHYYVYVRKVGLNWTSGWTKAEFTTLAEKVNPLCFIAKGGSVEVRFDIKNVTHTIQYSTDGANWTNYTPNATMLLANDGDKIYFSTAADQTTATAFGYLSEDRRSRFYFTSSNGGTVAASGNIMSLYGPSCPNLQLLEGAFAFMFSECDLMTTSPELPATNLANWCYFGMFDGCTSLITPPELPSTTLPMYCYAKMFYGCTSLITPPVLPATTLAVSCYIGMFAGCTSLAAAPELPATTLAEGCYTGMFSGCTSLITPPVLPATTLASKCYASMFSDCTSLVINTTAPGREWKIPDNATAVDDDWNSKMFDGTGGNFTNDPEIGVTYYIASAIDIEYQNVTYTINSHNDTVTLVKAVFGEGSLTDADFDISYAVNQNESNMTDFLNYKHKFDVPTSLTKDDTTYTIDEVKAYAFDKNELTGKVRVNVPVSQVTGLPKNTNIIIRPNGTPEKMCWNGNNYYCSKAYKLNTDDAAISIVQQPLGNQPLKVSCHSDEEETEIGETKVYTRKSGAILKCDKEGGMTEGTESNSHLLVATLNEEEVTITPQRINSIRVAENAKYLGSLEGYIEECEELTFQMDVTTTATDAVRKYPECDFTSNILLNARTKVKAEMKLDNKEYYYFSLPFDCDISNINVVASDGSNLVRSYSIDAAVYSFDTTLNFYVILKWDESKYVSGTTNGYTALNQEATMLNANKGYVIVVVESYNSWKTDHDTVLTATATFTANSDYNTIISQTDNVSIPTTNSDATLKNPYNGWNLVGNPYYNKVQAAQYSYGNGTLSFMRKIEHDYGSSSVVRDYTTEIPALSAEIKPFEAVFIRQSDVSGQGSLVVSGSATAPVQQAMGAPAILPEYITLTLNENGKMIDRTTIINNVNAHDEYILDEDLLKAHLSSNEIYTINSGIDISFNKMDIVSERKVIPLGVKTLEAGNYTIALSEPLSSYAGSVVLHDKKLNTYYDLTDGESETLSLNKGKTSNRLELIVTGSNVISGGSNIEDDGAVEVYVNGNVATISGIEEGAIVTICDATGKTLYSTEATTDRIDYQFPVRGVYMITVRGARVTTTKVMY